MWDIEMMGLPNVVLEVTFAQTQGGEPGEVKLRMCVDGKPINAASPERAQVSSSNVEDAYKQLGGPKDVAWIISIDEFKAFWTFINSKQTRLQWVCDL